MPDKGLKIIFLATMSSSIIYLPNIEACELSAVEIISPAIVKGSKLSIATLIHKEGALPHIDIPLTVNASISF